MLNYAAFNTIAPLLLSGLLLAACNSGGSSDSSTPSQITTAPEAPQYQAPEAGEQGRGAPCPEPVQAELGADWPEVFVGIDNCNDEGEGHRAEPFCTFPAAFSAVPSAPAIVTVLDGDYRLIEHWDEGRRNIHLHRPGTEDGYFVIRAEAGSSPLLIGSQRLEAGIWHEVGEGLWRTDAAGLSWDAKGLWLSDGRRIIHEMEMRDGVRSHAPVQQLSEPGSWTKANGGGEPCGTESNEGCFLYVRPFADTDMSSATFEASQGHFISAIGCPYLVMEGLTFRFTQSAASFFENCDFLLIQDNDFGHNANGNDNAYSIFISYSQGVMVRRNKAFDSRYWGGAGSNSKGITFMVSGDEEPLYACYNEVWDILNGGITTKSGVSNLHVVGNYIHDVGSCVQVPGPRCHWHGCEGEGDQGHTFASGNWTIRENILERCGSGISYNSRASEHHDFSYEYRNYAFNNLFIDCTYGVNIGPWTVGQTIRNNIFMGSGVGLYLNNAAGEDRWPDWFLARGLDSDYNIFDTDTAIQAHINWTGAGRHPLSLADYQADYEGEENSFETLPLLDDNNHYRPLPGSPSLGLGDPAMYQGSDQVNIGLWPFFSPAQL